MTLEISSKMESREMRGYRSSARLRARVLAVLSAALDRESISRTELAKRLGIKKSAVSQVLNGNGNIQLSTLAEYMSALNLEVDLLAVRYGELDAARFARRAPEHITLTISDGVRVQTWLQNSEMYPNHDEIVLNGSASYSIGDALSSSETHSISINRLEQDVRSS